MIMYCDTSALVKLYIAEEDSHLVTKHLAEVEAVAVCRIAWAEAYAALSRRAREVPADADTIDLAKAALATDWPHFVILEINQGLVERAGDYADTFALRGYDSIQLAAAHETAITTQSPTLFACFDSRLNKAAKTLGMLCL
jgi:uncharacterized protein